ncbi:MULTISPECIES: hypothetical protein [unclassified Frondihabitans]|uniref:hypothetical protein n=1 Tax=unclassified Frondihabitans TaxID=2626248 RepID=UPI000F515E03|nr:MULTISPECIES: hypothetical protein [unclassified Frondihabitans]RPE74376.1 hypothetical protein EDF37_3117 [Frondihabitans sp. PhB153]RPF02805.1 hypothetical protein EDF39_3185 [Frondihabitans sp. PhB161]
MDDRRRDLERRVYGRATPDPADVAELNRLLGGTSVTKRAAQDPALAPAEGDAGGQHEPRARPARAWLAGGVVAVIAAALIGAGVSQSIRAASTGDSPGTPVSSAVQRASAADGAVAETLGDEYFDQVQTKGDIPDVTLPRIDASSTRRVLAQWGQSDGGAGIWVARGTDRSYCLVLSVGSTRGASSCTPRAQAAATGVRLDLVTAGGASISARWNISAGILGVSPFPAGQKSPESVDLSATPQASTHVTLDTSSGAIVVRSGAPSTKP